VSAFLYWLGVVIGALWVARGLDTAYNYYGFPDLTKPEHDLPAPGARLSVVVPARNEEKMIGKGLHSLLKLDYRDYEIIAVDDRSEDRTGIIMESLAAKPEAQGKLKVIHITELPPDWLGKAHAMWTGAKAATGDWILFTDADVVFAPESLRRAVGFAERTRADHLVLFPTIETHNLGEAMMNAFFQLTFGTMFGPRRVADPKWKMVYVGAGAFNLVRRSAYEAMGTYAALRYDVIDDLNLGKLIKRAGFQQRMAMGLGLLRLRWIEGTMGMTQNLTKNAFAAFRYSVSITVLLMAAGVILNVLPFAAPLLPWPISQGYWVALAAILAFYLGMWWRVGTSPLLFVLHPVSFLIMSSAVVQSVGSTLRNGGVVWRGTRYPLEELRRRRA
jgi:glycosyltransferase involved in cell wall biosynthesis